jgi:N-acetylneuraminic acid mutarotase
MRVRLRRWAGCAALITSVVTTAALGLLAIAPAQASTAAPAVTASTQAKAAQSAPATSPRAAAWAAAVKADAAHYTNAPCNTTQKAGYARCYSVVHTAVKNKIAADTAGPPSGALGPAQIQSAYDLPSASAGSGQTVAIVDAYGDSTAESDLAAFRSYYGLPACTTANGCFTKVAQDGSTNYPGDAGSWALETSLDLDAVSSACPNCHILLVEADDNSFQNLAAAEDEAVSLGAKFISNSYGGCEYSGDTELDQYYNHPGVVIDFASGDYGYDNTQAGCDTPNYPASSPYVTSVGGTTLTQDPSSPRGWDETAWVDTGSGCSTVEPQPAYQQNIASITSTCPDNRATNDISADADPNSGLAVYDTDDETGWLQVGGTSLSTPLVTAMYALAGTPAPGTYPVTYPYADPHQSADLNDITTGSNGSCSTDLCNAGPGWDGPTGLGTPHGVAALAAGPQGVISGRVTSNGKPVSGATISAAGGITYAATTDSFGDYKLTVPAGSYTLNVTAFDHDPATVTGVTVGADNFTNESIRLTTIPEQKLSGTITDGSGAGWPLYAKITISGDPSAIYSYPGAVYTSPYTGRYSVDLPQDATYQLQVTPVFPGYNTGSLTAHVGATSVVQNGAITVDAAACSAPGYAPSYLGLYETFDGSGWGTGSLQEGTADGWTSTGVKSSLYPYETPMWQFGDSFFEPPPPGGDDKFAHMDDGYWTDPDDAYLISPVVNLSGQSLPEIAFDSEYALGPAPQWGATVDLSLDGGQTWSTVWSAQAGSSAAGYVQIPIPQAAGNADVQVRFHYIGLGQGSAGPYWAIDNVQVGTKLCDPTNAGLVAGVVRDGNTGMPVDGAQVAISGSSSQSVLTEPSADPAFPDGFYWLQVPAGSTTLTASDNGYASSTATVNVTAGSVTQQNYTLAAGQLSVSASRLSVAEPPGSQQTRQLTFTNHGTAPAQVSLGEQDGGFTTAATRPSSSTSPAAAPQVAPGIVSPAAGPILAKQDAAAGRPAAAQPQSTPADQTPPASSWTSLNAIPEDVYDNSAATDPATGDVYSAGGYGITCPGCDSHFPTWNVLAAGYVYDPTTQQWSQIASLPQPVEAGAGAFLDGKMFVAGGWDVNGNPLSSVYAYDPLGNTWSQVASLPTGVAAAAVTTLNGQLYVVGGCTTGTCDPTVSTVYRYSPAANRWTQLASYPQQVAFLACAGINSEIVCAGGLDNLHNIESASTYIYDPHTNSWSQGADMPSPTWGMSYTGSGNQLQIANGVFGGGIVQQAYEYDPSANTWTSLPQTGDNEYRGGGACGFYVIGGASEIAPRGDVEQLAGYEECGSVNVPWLSVSQSSFTVQPGQSVTVTVTADSSAVTQAGTYRAYLSVNTSTPYTVQPVAVTLKVTG